MQSREADMDCTEWKLLQSRRNHSSYKVSSGILEKGECWERVTVKIPVGARNFSGGSHGKRDIKNHCF